MAWVNETTQDFPRLGLGLSSNLGAGDAPHPYRLLDAEPSLFDFVEYSAPLSLEETRAQATLFPEMWARRAATPVLFHPVHLNLSGPRLESPERLAALSEHCLQVGSPWVGNDVGWWHHEGRPFPGYLYLAPAMTQAGLDDCVAHAKHVQAHVQVPLVLENPAVFRREGPLHILDFMAALHVRTGCGLLVDLGHLLSFQLSHGHPPTTGFEGFPWEAVIEVHLAGGVVTRRGERRFYVDDHSQPIRSEVLGLLEEVVPRCRRLSALTYEGDGHPDGIAAKTLRYLRPFAPKRAEEAEVRSSPSATVRGETGFAPKSDFWQTFERVHGSPGTHEDSEGLEAEVDYRLALVAEEVDKSWSLSRMLLAPGKEGLSRFTASREFRAAFEEEGGSLGMAFARFARKEIIQGRRTGASSVLAFETWAHGLLSRPAGRELWNGGWVLGRGVVLGVFAADLSEFLFGAKALRRHLTQRGWASGTVEDSGLEALQQLADRAAPGPWAVVVRKAFGRLEIRGLSTELSSARAQGPVFPSGFTAEVRRELDEGAEAGWWSPPSAPA